MHNWFSRRGINWFELSQKKGNIILIADVWINLQQCSADKYKTHPVPTSNVWTSHSSYAVFCNQILNIFAIQNCSEIFLHEWVLLDFTFFPPLWLDQDAPATLSWNGVLFIWSVTLSSKEINSNTPFPPKEWALHLLYV